MDIERICEVVKLEQFVDCLPTEIHRWVVEKWPKLLVDAAKLADEYAVLYNPFKLDHMYSPKLDHKADKHLDRGKSQQNFKAEGNDTKPFIRNWAPDVLCIRFDQGCHTALVCRHQISKPEPPKVVQIV